MPKNSRETVGVALVTLNSLDMKSADGFQKFAAGFRIVSPRLVSRRRTNSS